MNAPPRVVLLHGLWMPALAMRPLARKLARAGFLPECHAWSPRREGVAGAAHRLLARWGPEPPRLYVGHSLGGWLALALAARLAPRPSRVVALGTPFAGSLAARRLAAVPPARWLLGDAGNEVAKAWPGGVPAGIALGLVAGTVHLGLGRWVARVGGPGDGTVRLDETRLDGAAARVALPVAHFGMLFSSPVAAATAAFLHDGKFPVNLHEV